MSADGGRGHTSTGGELVPDQVVIDLVTPAAVAAAAAGELLLDGFPRTTPQALAAADLGLRLGIRFQAVVYLDVPEDELTARLLRRATKQGRTDDTPEVIRHRLHVFAKETQPLTEYYRSRESCFPSTATNRSKR